MSFLATAFVPSIPLPLRKSQSSSPPQITPSTFQSSFVGNRLHNVQKLHLQHPSTHRPGICSLKAMDDDKNYSMKTRLREETEAPFRKVRLFAYTAAIVSASLGAFISGSRVIAYLLSVPNTQPLNETGPNFLINTGVVALGALLIRQELKAGERRLERLQRGATFAALRVRKNTATSAMITGKKKNKEKESQSEEGFNDVMKMSAFRQAMRPLIIAGQTIDDIDEIIKFAMDIKDELIRRDIIVIPVVFGGTWSSNWKSDILWRPINDIEWEKWVRSELLAGKVDTFKNRVYVFSIKKNGRVATRSLGPPNWNKLLAQLDLLERGERKLMK